MTDQIELERDMATARVLDVGNCDADHWRIQKMLCEHFDVEVDQVMFVDEALAKMRERSYTLVLFNRLSDEDGSEGIELLRKGKADPALRGTPMMMISNYPDAQAASVEAGGVVGFGKAALDDPKTAAMLAKYLPEK